MRFSRGLRRRSAPARANERTTCAEVSRLRWTLQQPEIFRYLARPLFDVTSASLNFRPPPRRGISDAKQQRRTAALCATLGSTCPRAPRHDGDVEPAICLDAVHGLLPDSNRRGPRRRAGDLLCSDPSANLAFSGTRLADRPVRTARAHRLGSGAVRARLDAGQQRRQPRRTLLYLRLVLRHRHRLRLCRRHRPDGALVSRSTWLRRRGGRGRLWLWRAVHHFSHRHDDRQFRLSPDTRHLRPDPRWRRRDCGIVSAQLRSRRKRRCHASPVREHRPARCCARRSSG